jgi:predicted nucleic acid-binding protein
VTYWDTSALFKVYAEEADSAWFLDFLDRSHTPVRSSSISAVEIVSAAYRQLRAKNLKPFGISEIAKRLRIHRETGRLIHVPCSDEVVTQAQQIIERAAHQSHPIMIRGMDAIHVASALVIGAKTVVATDVRVRSVASFNGLKLIPVAT